MSVAAAERQCDLSNDIEVNWSETLWIWLPLFAVAAEAAAFGPHRICRSTENKKVFLHI
jgi:hypothetical protein